MACVRHAQIPDLQQPGGVRVQRDPRSYVPRIISDPAIFALPAARAPRWAVGQALLRSRARRLNANNPVMMPLFRALN